ncbi:hypothetical protein N7457_002454 [Penicillium paradoxum]|uniref:uncharacterized protein n=1 Tax=Penicillium paradoxum TaxID=176176 RepID=UPI002547765C|nr:uncharacterized protein N7457_002454 [Penicillium paradoxum]KAJ5787464.1 hypothetical protein N7457_002454 [Penicillium paradoxum]
MSAQIPHPPTPKGSRNNRRPQKKNMTPQAPKTGLLSTPPSSPPHNMTPGVIPTDILNNFNSSKKKPPRSGKKQREPKASPATHNGYHTTRVSLPPPTKTNAPAYAGPTFHASPAPSALPMPSFFSKSAPDSNLAPPIETDSDDAEEGPEPDVTPSKPRSRNMIIGEEQKPSPIDFLFQAAVQARDHKSTGSPELSKAVRSPQTEPRAQRPNGDGMFAFEMGNSHNSRISQIGPSFAPSYQDRMNALRPSSTPQSPDVAEEQRRIKTEELKHLLLNPPPQKPPSSAHSSHDYAGTFGPRPSNVPPYATPMRTSSGPQLTMSHGSFSPQHQYQQPASQHTGRHPYPYPNNSRSPLRREFDLVPPPSMPPYRGRASNGTSDAASNGPSPVSYGNPYMPSTQPQWHGYQSPQMKYVPASFHVPISSPPPSQAVDTQQIENDIRRVLKLDASSGVPPVTQSYA